MKTKNKRRFNNCHEGCPVETALDVIGNKWKGIVLYHLTSGMKRFNELKKLTPGVSIRVLTLQLRQLEADQLIVRKVYPQVPPKVEYSLTKLGMSLKPILFSLRDWGKKFQSLNNL